MEYNNDPKLLDEVFHARFEKASFHREINSYKEIIDFLRSIITTLISK